VPGERRLHPLLRALRAFELAPAVVRVERVGAGRRAVAVQHGAEQHLLRQLAAAAVGAGLLGRVAPKVDADLQAARARRRGLRRHRGGAEQRGDEGQKEKMAGAVHGGGEVLLRGGIVPVVVRAGIARRSHRRLGHGATPPPRKGASPRDTGQPPARYDGAIAWQPPRRRRP
jgi:hypothetical protein